MIPKQIVYFTTSKGKLWLDLEQVACVFSSDGPNGEDQVSVSLKSSFVIFLNLSFKADLDTAMAAWADFKNAGIAEESADLVFASEESGTHYKP